MKVGVAYSRNKLALRTRLRNLNLKSLFSIFNSFRDIYVHIYNFLKFVGGLWSLKWAWQTLFRSNDRYWWEKYISVKIFILASKL